MNRNSNLRAIIISSLSASFIGCAKGEIPSKLSSVDVLEIPHPGTEHETSAAELDSSAKEASREIASVDLKKDYSAKAQSAMQAVKDCFHASSGKSLFINTRNPEGYMLEADVTCTGQIARTLRNKLSEVDPQVNFQLSKGPSSEKIFFGKKEIVSNSKDKRRGIANLNANSYTFEGSSCTKEMPDIYSCELKFRMPLTERLEQLLKK